MRNTLFLTHGRESAFVLVLALLVGIVSIPSCGRQKASPEPPPPKSVSPEAESSQPKTPPSPVAPPADKSTPPEEPADRPEPTQAPVGSLPSAETESAQTPTEDSDENPEEAASDFDGMNLDMTPEELATWKKEQEEFRKKELEQRRKAIAALGEPLVENPENLKRLDPFFPVWIDPEGKRLVLLGAVAQERAPLEMFACLRGTKEHESVVVIDTKAFIVHAGLLALGAEAGHPVRFQPEYAPASGTEIAIDVAWKDKDGNVQTTKAQDWVRNVETNEPLKGNWVFAGSGFWTDDQTGKRHYQAEGGDFICVSNFPSAMLDLPIESTQANSGLMFEAFTEKIPPRGTPVTVILKPQLKPQE